MMLRWLVICVLACAIAKWSGNVKADEPLDEEEKRLLEALEDVLVESNAKRGMSCANECSNSPSYDSCMADCKQKKMLEKRMEMAARKQEAANKELGGHQKKFFRRIRIPPIRLPPLPRIPPVRLPRIPLPRIPPIRLPRIPLPRIPPVRIPRIPPVRRWWGKK